MTAPSAFAYDEVPYGTEANSEAHPRSMGTLARLFGIDAPLASTARVLEIGCGDGEHLVAAASYLPEARFVGFDLSSAAIARGIAAAAASGVVNVELLHRDLTDVAKTTLGTFDYVLAHGVYSWVPVALRPDVLRVMRDALAPNGVAFLSANALPGWELRRTLRAIMREASAHLDDPASKVAAALAAVDALASAPESSGAGSFASVIASAAREYREHVEREKPPDAAFSRYAFHDLLAECNDPFSVDDLVEHAEGAGLRVLCATPGASSFDELRAGMHESGAPFVQVLLVRDDATPRAAPDAAEIARMHLWADLSPAGAPDLFRTTTGAVLRAGPGSAIARAAASAPGFVAVETLAAAEADRAALAQDLLSALRDGSLLIAAEPIPLVDARSRAEPLPPVSSHVRTKAALAVDRSAASAVVTSALHRSFRVPLVELEVIRHLDGTLTEAALVARVGDATRVATVLDRLSRHGFFVERAS